MLFNLRTAASFLALCAFTASAAVEQKRATDGVTTLYAYGAGGRGSVIFYVDGLAYFGNSSAYTNTTSTVVTDVTFDVESNNTTVPWSITPANSTVTFNETMTLYIVPASGSFQQVGFAASSDLPDGAVNVGFDFFGTQVAYVQSTSNWEMSFWSNSTTTSGVWALFWNGEGAGDPSSGAFPVVVKTTPPTVLQDTS